jgi:5-hydroxyisourate hydrolase
MRVSQCVGLTLIGLTLMLSESLSGTETGDGPPAHRGALSIHVLNTASGRPAAGVAVVLERQAGKDWEDLGRGKTDASGRADDLYPRDKPLQAGAYRLVYDTGAYFKSQGVKTFFPLVEVVFEVEKTDEHYHVPLLLSPYGYSTYRGG